MRHTGSAKLEPASVGAEVAGFRIVLHLPPRTSPVNIQPLFILRPLSPTNRCFTASRGCGTSATHGGIPQRQFGASAPPPPGNTCLVTPPPAHKLPSADSAPPFGTSNGCAKHSMA
ncbi:hypothetical protein EJ06DRAFT_525823 [Trichodelitschia bisporula]|uniref:Uncharacterized protein n=1 Tax=Trichodelitschia bisporula TaxID=703511 RepID=A0A6G1IB80_9PEZI|nr:hypothetical protein EJ06DRAFT_525823 [Trichodelitschia bisporula]